MRLYRLFNQWLKQKKPVTQCVTGFPFTVNVAVVYTTFTFAALNPLGVSSTS